MARNNISLVPPPTSFGRELLIGFKDAGANDLQSFDTINDALNYIKALPAEEKPSLGHWFMLRCHPGIYDENVWLPKYVGLSSDSYIGTIIRGDPDDRICPIVSIATGYLKNILLYPPTTHERGLFIRNANSAYTTEDIGTINAGDTLIVIHN